MRRTIVAAFPLALVFSCFSASPTFADAGWEACVSAPHRACVLDELLEAGSAGKSAASRASVIASVSAAQARAGLSADAAKSLARALEEAQALEAPERDLPRAAIAVAEADAGDFAAAMGSAGSVEAVPLRSSPSSASRGRCSGRAARLRRAPCFRRRWALLGQSPATNASEHSPASPRRKPQGGCRPPQHSMRR